MRRLKHAFLAIGLTLSTLAAIAGISDLPTRTINGKLYHYYTVEPKETLYSLQHKLGVDRETILRYNPSVQDGLQAHQTLYFPVETSSAKSVSNTAAVPSLAVAPLTHQTKKGETIYGIAHSYDVSVDDLIAANPSLRDGMKAGQTIQIPIGGVTATTTPITTAAKAQTPAPAVTISGVPYTIKNGETLYAIAKAHDITTDDILAANPDLSPTFYHGGLTIILPISGESESTSPTPPAEVAQPEIAATEPIDYDEEEAEEEVPVATEEVEVEEPEDVYATEAPTRSNETSIAVMLPFMLNEKQVSKQAARYTEFYKGLLLAVDSLKSSSKPIILYAYDTAASLDTVKAILRNPELKSVQMIIAPPDEAQLKAVGDFGAANNVMVLNPFLIKDESYKTNPCMMQASVSSPDLLKKAVAGLVSRYGNRTPVILRRTGGTREHEDFIDAVKEAYLDIDISPELITYTDKLTPENLARLTPGSKDYIFIPYEGKLAEANKYLPALAEYRESLPDPSRVMVMGYPEWITFRNEARTNMSKANTLIYSRFFSDDDSYGARKANDQFTYWYGSAPGAAEPKQGFLGLDLGMWLIKALRANDGDFNLDSPKWDGVQNGFHFVSPATQQGWSNDVIYFINYRPSGLIDRIEF